MHRLMKLCPYRLWTHLAVGMEQTGWAMMSITCKGIEEHVCHYAHTCDPTHLHTHQGKDKKKVWLKLKMHFNKSMCMITGTHLKINTDTMHQYVSGLAALKTMMHILSNELDRGSILVYSNETEVRVFFQKDVTIECMNTIMDDQILASVHHHQSSQGCWRVGLTTTVQLLVMSCMAFSSHFLSHGYMCILDVAYCEVEDQVSIFECKSHRVVEESWGLMSS